MKASASIGRVSVEYDSAKNTAEYYPRPTITIDGQDVATNQYEVAEVIAVLTLYLDECKRT